MLNVNGIIHLIGGYDNNKHFVWNDRHRNVHEIHGFREELDDTTDLSLILMITWFEVWKYDYIQMRKWTKIRSLKTTFYC